MTTILSELRGLAPHEPLALPEALMLAERQADRFLTLIGVIEPPVPEDALSRLPKLAVEYLDLDETAAAAQWSLGRWLILVNASSTRGRQRFSLFHEFKHILDHPTDRSALPLDCPGKPSASRIEQICDYFSACVLMPRAWVEAAWYGGATDPATLAHQFRVSLAAMRVRLLQIGLIEARASRGRH